MLVLFAPVALHAAFDFPLLTLQKHPDIDHYQIAPGSASVLIGFSSSALRSGWCGVSAAIMRPAPKSHGNG